MALFDVKGKNFIVTGGASGMGAEYAQKFLDQGAKGIAILDIAVAKGEALVKKHSAKYPGQVVFIRCDMSKEEEIAKAFDEAVSKLKQIDVIINNAGIMVDTPQVWRIAADVNWQGVVSMSLKGIKHMSKLEGGVGGTIVNIASIAAFTKGPMLPIYCGGKMAVMHFSQSIATKAFYESTGVRFLCMCFGATDTPLLDNFENKGFDISFTKYGKAYEDEIESIKQMHYQKIESAIAAVDYIIKNGPNASIWVSMDDKPARNVTPIVDEAFDMFQKSILS